MPETGSKGPHHVFVTQLNNAATGLNYSSYLSGNGDDIASGMTVDNNENIFLTGTTTSTDPGVTGGSQFPATAAPNFPPFQAFSIAPIQFFVTEVSTTSFGNLSVAYSTFFGGAVTSSQAPIVANGGGIAVDINDNVYFTGTTNFIFTGSSRGDFPILNAYQPCLDQPPPAVITNPPNCLNNVTFPDAFVAKLTPNPPAGGGAQLQWSTYFGGSQSDAGNGVAVDTGAANVYIVGTTNSPDFVIPTTVAPYQKCLNNLPPTPPSGIIPPPGCTAQTAPAPSDAFVARFNNPSPTTTNPTFNVALTYFSYLGGPQNEAGYAITVDNAADAIVTGLTTSPNLGAASTFPIFPTPNDGIQSNLNGPQDAFLARINTATQNGQNSNGSFATYFGGSGVEEGTSVAIDGNQNIYFAGDTNSAGGANSIAFQVADNGNIQNQLNGGFDSFVTKLSPASILGLTGQLQLGNNQVFISAGNPATFVYTLTNNGPDVANSVTITDNLVGTGVPVSNIQAGVSGATGTCTQGGSLTTGVVCTIPQMQSAGVATITITMTPAATASGNPFDFNGGTLSAQAANAASNGVTVTAQMSDYTISAQPNNFTLLAAGDTATYQVELIPHPIYASNISLSASGNPPGGGRAVFSTSTVSLANSSSGGATLNISTIPRPIVTPGASLFTRRVYYAVWLSLPGMALLGLGTRDKRRRRILGLIALCAVFGLILVVPACSHGTTQVPASGTPAGTYTITITASSGGDSKSTSVTLTVP